MAKIGIATTVYSLARRPAEVVKCVEHKPAGFNGQDTYIDVQEQCDMAQGPSQGTGDFLL